MDQTTIPGSVPSSSSKGPFVGIVIVVALLVIGALYFWGARLNQEAAVIPYIPDDSSAAMTPKTDTTWTPPQGTSDDAAAIEADLKATDMNGFDASMKADAAAANSSI